MGGTLQKIQFFSDQSLYGFVLSLVLSCCFYILQIGQTGIFVKVKGCNSFSILIVAILILLRHFKDQVNLFY